MKRAACYSLCVRRTLLALAALLFAGGAQAEWSAVGRNEDFRVFLDLNLIQRKDGFAQVWQLTDFTSAKWADAQTAVGSIKNLLEFDCSQMRFRMLAGEAFSEKMEAGRVVANEHFSDPEWLAVQLGGTAEKVRQIACGRE